MDKTLTADDLYAISMDSHMAYRLMPLLCAALDADYPPKHGDMTPITGKTELTLLIEKTLTVGGVL